jgi:hypothetical protein
MSAEATMAAPTAAPAAVPLAAGGVLPVRVTVQEVWDELPFEVAPSMTAGELKARALRAVRIRTDPDGFVLKFRGAEVFDDVTLEAARVVPNAALIVCRRRRRAVR